MVTETQGLKWHFKDSRYEGIKEGPFLRGQGVRGGCYRPQAFIGLKDLFTLIQVSSFPPSAFVIILLL